MKNKEKLAKLYDEEESGKWIPCSEKLPEVNIPVLAQWEIYYSGENRIEILCLNDLGRCSVYGDIEQDQQGNYYTTGEQRTGCMFCGFGAHLEEEPNRFQRMSVTHPKCYEICMNLESNGVKYKDALETCGIGTETWEQMGQMDIFDFIGGMQ